MLPLLELGIIDTGGREIHAEVGGVELLVGGFEVVAVAVVGVDVSVDASSGLVVNRDGGCNSGWD